MIVYLRHEKKYRLKNNSDTDYDIVCFEHHHIVHRFKSDERKYYNPGSNEGDTSNLLNGRATRTYGP
jgi:predicted phosphodiesterase